jgi:heat shock protein 5
MTLHVASAYFVFYVLLTSVGSVSAGSDEKKSSIDGPAVGIDLGTTYSCVGIYKNGRVEIISNDQGNRITPSYVAFADGDRLIGEAAKNQASVNPMNTVFDVKRLIGRRFKDSDLQKDLKLLPYKVVDQQGKPYIMVDVKGKQTAMGPEEISAMVLLKMKQTAENYIGKEVRHAVVTVPAYFNDAQRQATKDAGSIAGLNVLRIINEPTAAAIAYGLDKKEERNIMVFDLGGGTFDVSLLTIDNGVFEVVATSGDTHLGGEDFDHRILSHYVDVFKKKHGKNIANDKRAIAKLRREVEKAKRAVSSTHQARIEVESLFEGIDFSETFTRARFEDLNADLFKKTLGPVKQVLEDSGLTVAQVDEVLLVGGSTRIPKVQQLLKDMFKGKELNRGINPDEAVAYGAAVQAGILSGESVGSELLLLDVTPLTLGVDVKGGTVSALIPRNTVIPTRKVDSFTTTEDNQESTTFGIYEGERPMARDNHKLGQVSIGNIAPAPAGVPNLDVTFAIDANGILSVSVVDTASGNTKSTTISNDKGRLTEEQIARMMQDAEKYADEDKIAKARADARQSYETYLRSMQRSALDGSGGIKAKLNSDDQETLKRAVDDGMQWLNQNPEADADEVQEHQRDTESICAPIVGKAYGSGSDDEADDGGETDEL